MSLLRRTRPRRLGRPYPYAVLAELRNRVTGDPDLEALQQGTEVEVRTLDDLRQAMAALFSSLRALRDCRKGPTRVHPHLAVGGEVGRGRGTSARGGTFRHAVPVNKLFAFGGDTHWPTVAVAYSVQAWKGLRRALAAEVDAGYPKWRPRRGERLLDRPVGLSWA